MNAIELKKVYKRYPITLYQKPHQAVSFSDQINNAIQNLFYRNPTKSKKIFSAIQNITLDIKQGEIIGIIGSNGAGKSTLLKIIAGITIPTKGDVITYGRITSLLGIGVGFHNELSGRENIFLSGALLGFRKKEIEEDMENIIQFSGIGKFIDTPVKYYSSGMYIRLAFSIATSRCLNPDILLIDEVLSVGDEVFQKKSLDRIHELAQNGHTTILFVSHNFEIIELLSKKCLWMEKGEVRDYGKPKKIIKEYLKQVNTNL